MLCNGYTWCPQEFQIKISGHFQDKNSVFPGQFLPVESHGKKSGSDTHLSTATI